MSQSREGRSASRSPSRSPVGVRRSRSLSRSRGRSRSRSRDSVDVENPGNNLYVTGLSTRVSQSDLEKHFSTEGKILECHLVTDPRTRESRGFAFIMMETLEDAERCIKYLNRSVLEGRLITVEKAKRKRGRTPTPGRYHGVKDKRGGGRQRSRSYSPRRKPYRDAPYRDAPYRDAPYRDAPYRDAPYRDAPYRDAPSYSRNHRGRSPPRSPYGRRGEEHSTHYERRR